VFTDPVVATTSDHEVPSFFSTRYPVMAEPPLDPAVHVSVTSPSPAEACRPLIAEGVVDGVTSLVRARGNPVPADEIPDTRNLYAVPLLKPVIVAVPEAEPVSDTETLQVEPPSVDTSTRWPSNVAPLLAPGVQVKTTCPEPSVALRPDGRPGSATGVTEFDVVDVVDEPSALIAVTRKK
jgi:hypothetical protein